MKLRNIYLLCKENCDSIKNIQGESIKVDGKSCFRISGWANAVAAMKNLSEIDMLKEGVQLLLTAVPELYRPSNDRFVVSSDIWSKISTHKNTLLNSMKDIINLYESMGYNSEEKLGLDIKLPQCDDFTQFKDCVNDIDFLLTKCPFFKHDKEELKFETVDVGSIWITFLVIGASVATASVVLNNIAAFIDKCMVIKSHYNILKQQKIYLDEMNKKDTEKEEILKGLEDLYKHAVKKCIIELEQETNIKLRDGEEEGMVEKSFEKTIQLMEKGMQIHATLDSSPEIKALFEPLEMKYLENLDAKLLDKKDK